MNRWIILGMALSLAGAIVGRTILREIHSRQATSEATQAADATRAAPSRPPAGSPLLSSETPRGPAAVPAGSAITIGRAIAPARIPKPAVQGDAAHTPDPAPPANADAAATTRPTDLLPRLALSFVGMNEEAELLWAAAINDPDRDPRERRDLIEDLNEDGFPDPEHLTPDDLPLIVSRLILIEQLAPDSMDDVNAAAFAEAYKDLREMLDRAAR